MLDRDGKMEFMRARGRINFMVTDFMHHYAASRQVDHLPEGYSQEWEWLFGLSDPQRGELLGRLLLIFSTYVVNGNTQEDFDNTNKAIHDLQTLFSITQMTAGLGKTSALGA